MDANRNVRRRMAFRCVEDIVRFRPCGDLVCDFLDLRSLTALRATDTSSLRTRSILWSLSRRLSALKGGWRHFWKVWEIGSTGRVGLSVVIELVCGCRSCGTANARRSRDSKRVHRCFVRRSSRSKPCSSSVRTSGYMGQDGQGLMDPR